MTPATPSVVVAPAFFKKGKYNNYEKKIRLIDEETSKEIARSFSRLIIRKIQISAMGEKKIGKEKNYYTLRSMPY